ncbi:cell wall-binding repeat-containing protein [Microcella sp.]|uniref:cell wall-binding repeat-containing protein n=1 Tax=Microcella sp. TaxID=1913979 RepID=UPI003F71623A
MRRLSARGSRGALRALSMIGAVVIVSGLLAAPAAAATATGADRIAGVDRYETAVSVSREAFDPGVERVFIASGIDYPDALSAAPIAAALGAPLLLTARDALPASVVAELARLAPTVEVVLVGGTGVVSTTVESRLRQLGHVVARVQGLDRYATSRALVATYAAPSPTLYLATGRNYPDALAAAAAAGSIDAPVLLVDGNRASIDAPSLALLAARDVESVLIAGGEAVVSSGIERQLVDLGYTVRRLAGSDRYSTAVAINQYAFPSAQRAFVATGAGFADALAGAVHAAIENAPLYSSPPVCLPPATRFDMLERLRVERVTLLGGTGVLDARVQALGSCGSIDDDRAASAAELAGALQQRIATLPGTYSVSVRELDGLEVTVSVRGSVMQEPVSVIKVFAAYAILDRIDRGLLGFSTPTRSGVSVGDCLRVMIHVSDNYCHWDLVALVGEQNLNNQFWAEGYRGTVYAGYRGDGTSFAAKLATTDDLALLLGRLHRGELLSPALTDHLITLLETQLWRSKLPAGVPVGVPVGNKTGSAWSASGGYQSDAGIVSAPGGTYTIAVLGSDGATANGVRDLGRIVYEHFNGAVGTAASYSDLNAVTTGALTYYRYGSTSTPLGVIPAGTLVAVDSSARTWYLVIYDGAAVYVQSSGLRNAIDYPRSSR